ncbi:HD domain-containing protein [Rhizobium viscosum]|uniref:(P)ppGpp synthase/HD superfamily hydrolase n=2 Tax=Rhizobium viscosum TaxID=1673 RepID=A0ABR9IYH5_RHIVS|nr:(p)ppGpp synthase/HD superfamily hydrolase [Rhizobium viscosum]
MDAHDGQCDKVGNPYFEHCQRVADLVVGEEEKIVAYLHDIPEKAPGWTIDRLSQEGFSSRVIAAVDALTRRPDEDDDSLVRRACANPLARPVKQADLEDNRIQSEQAGLDPGKFERGLAILMGRER